MKPLQSARPPLSPSSCGGSVCLVGWPAVMDTNNFTKIGVRAAAAIDAIDALTPGATWWADICRQSWLNLGYGYTTGSAAPLRRCTLVSVGWAACTPNIMRIRAKVLSSRLVSPSSGVGKRQGIWFGEHSAEISPRRDQKCTVIFNT